MLRELPSHLTFFLWDESQVFVPRGLGPVSAEAAVTGGESRGKCYQYQTFASSAYHLAAQGTVYAEAKQACGSLQTMESAQFAQSAKSASEVGTQVLRDSTPAH